ncbi:MAG: DUF4292 domain-containing protein [Ferruginibacter sp.]
MRIFYLLFILTVQCTLFGCTATKQQISSSIITKDTATDVIVNNTDKLFKDSVEFVKQTLHKLDSNYINFKTFNAKVKVEVDNVNGKQPDITATLRMVKDSAIWISLTATFLNIEVYRAYITKDSVILLNKQDKEVQYRSLDYLQEVTEIPFNFQTLQDMIIGNPIFFEAKNASFRKTDQYLLGSSWGDDFKNLLSLTLDNYLLKHSKLDDININRNRTASITYDDYEIKFSTKRQIIISEKNKIDIRLNFKQFEFNKELSVSFSVPKNYKKK